MLACGELPLRPGLLQDDTSRFTPRDGMASRIDIQRDGPVLTLGWTLWGRVVGGFYRAVKIFPWLAGIAAVFFLPDYWGRYAEEEPVPGLFWGSILALVLLGCFLFGVLRVVRDERWMFDGEERSVIAEVQLLWASPKQGEIPLRNLEAVELTTRTWPFSSELAIRIDDPEAERDREVVFEEPGMASEFEKAADAIMEFLKQERYHDVELIRGEDGGD